MEVLPKADFTEANILEDVIRDIGKSMLENVNKYKYLQEDYKDFIEIMDSRNKNSNSYK